LSIETEWLSSTPPPVEGGTLELGGGHIHEKGAEKLLSRVDRKRKVAPYVPQFIKAHIHDVARYLRTSEDGAGVKLVLAALTDSPTLNRLAPYMWRDYAYGAHAWIGHRDHENLNRLINPPGHITERINLRFLEDDWSSLDALGFALGKPVAHATAALLRLAHDYPRVTDVAAPGFVSRSPYSLKWGTVQWPGMTRS
jgi:hypothetical protein